MTMLEHIPLGTEFAVGFDSVHLQVDDGSWGALHAGRSADYPYAVPAIVLFYKGIRIAYSPLVGEGVIWNADCADALLIFWKWSKNTTWKPRAWLVQVTNAPSCVFQIAFFPGEEHIEGDIDLKLAMEYVGMRAEPTPKARIFSFFAKADKICLNSQQAGNDGIALQWNNEIVSLPVGMYEEQEISENKRKYYKTQKWLTMEELEEKVSPQK